MSRKPEILVDIFKLIALEIFLIVVGIAGFISFYFLRNYFGLIWGINCSIVFVLLNIIVLVFLIDTTKNKKKGE